MTREKMIEKVRELLAKGETRSAIAAKLGVNKNIVSGIVWRDIQHYQPLRREKIIKIKKPKISKIKDKKIKMFASKPLPKLPAPIQQHIEKPIGAFISFPDKRFMTDGHCRYIIGEPRNLVCCGCATSNANVFCDLHRRAVYEKPRKVVI